MILTVDQLVGLPVGTRVAVSGKNLATKFVVPLGLRRRHVGILEKHDSAGVVINLKKEFLTLHLTLEQFNVCCTLIDDAIF